jgi:hypothetical protein
MLISPSAKESLKAENVTLKMTQLKNQIVDEVNGGLILRVWILDDWCACLSQSNQLQRKVKIARKKLV